MTQTLRYAEVRRGANTDWVVMAHGFGANAEDLRSLAAALDPDGRWNWLFPEGPVVLGRGVFGRSCAWFPRTTEELQRVADGSYFTNLAAASAPGLTAAADEVIALLSSLRIDPGLAVFGGFSQGSMVALECALHSPPRGLILFSSALIARDSLVSRVETIRSVPFMQSHGEQDTVLSFADGEALYALLAGAGLTGDFLSFRGGHEIPPQAVATARRFLQTVASS